MTGGRGLASSHEPVGRRVIGLTVGGAAIGGRIGVGLNEFLGIHDAWRALQVEPQVTTVDAATLAR